MKFNYMNSIVLSISGIHSYLRTNTYASFLEKTRIFWWIFGKHYILKHYIRNSNNCGIIRIWKTNINSNLYIDNMDKENCIASLDYFIGIDAIEIMYFLVKNIELSRLIDDKAYFGCDETSMFIHSLIVYIGNIANEKKIKKIIINIHPNLIMYNTYFKREGFILTNNRGRINKYTMEAVLSII